MSTNPRPESRISELEAQMATHGARIRELSDDTAESLRDLKQDIKNLDEGITASYKSIGDTFVAMGDDIKRGLATLRSAQDARFDKIEGDMAELKSLMLQLLKGKSGE